jgi:hypothetical protein
VLELRFGYLGGRVGQRCHAEPRILQALQAVPRAGADGDGAANQLGGDRDHLARRSSASRAPGGGPAQRVSTHPFCGSRIPSAVARALSAGRRADANALLRTLS